MDKVEKINIQNGLNYGIMDFFREFYKIAFKKEKVNTMSSFMIKEIKEQPEILSNLLSKYIVNDDYILLNIPLNITKMRIIASGTSYHCASLMTHLFKEHTDLNVNCNYSSEFILKKHFTYDQNTLYVFISQSGETSDTLAAIKKVKEKGIKTLCITNCEKSTLWELADYKILTEAHEERSIASTKALTAQVLCLYLLLLKYMKAQGKDITQKLEELKSLPEALSEVFSHRKKIKNIAKILTQFSTVVILGNGINYSIAQEGALKVKETSYININAFPHGEFMHGHVALLNKKGAVISIIDDDNFSSNMKNLQKIKTDYNPKIITISSQKDIESASYNFYLSDEVKIHKYFNLIIFFQLLAFETATLLKRNIDRPSGLKKVVIE